MDVGLNVPLAAYPQWFPAMAPAVPAFSRIFVPPKGRLPEFGRAPLVALLPPQTLPWISHKDQLPLTQIAAYWSAMPRLTDGRRYRWTYFHESAPLTMAMRDSWEMYWNALVSLHADHERSAEIELVNIQTAFAIRFNSEVNYRDYVIPGVTFGLDCYPRFFGTGYEPPESLFAMGHAVAREFEVPWCVPELGAEPRVNGNRSDWFRESLSYLRETGCTAVGLWCSTENRNRQFYDYRPDPDTLDVWRSAMASS